MKNLNKIIKAQKGVIELRERVPAPTTYTTAKGRNIKVGTKEFYDMHKGLSDAVVTGRLQYDQLPDFWKYYIPSNVKEKRIQFDNEYRAERQRYENSSTGQAMKGLSLGTAAVVGGIPLLAVAGAEGAVEGVKQGIKYIPKAWNAAKTGWTAFRALPRYQQWTTHAVNNLLWNSPDIERGTPNNNESKPSEGLSEDRIKELYKEYNVPYPNSTDESDDSEWTPRLDSLYNHILSLGDE